MTIADDIALAFFLSGLIAASLMVWYERKRNLPRQDGEE